LQSALGVALFIGGALAERALHSPFVMAHTPRMRGSPCALSQHAMSWFTFAVVRKLSERLFVMVAITQRICQQIDRNMITIYS
jgi:hypothetical protein